MAMRVALYARVSTQRQAQAQTVEQQVERLMGHACQQGWGASLDHVFRDDGYSGASLRRPGLDRLRDRAAARSLDLVLITAPDRLARNYVHQVLLLEELQGHGCEVRFLDRPMSQDPHDQLLLQIRGAVAEYERTLITERMRRGRQRKLEAGLMLPWTRAPFGYRVDPDRPRDPAGVRIEEAEAAIVREMFAWYAEETHSFCSLARLLEQRGIRTSTGLARWNLASIRALLTNPAYAGQVYGNRWHRRGTLERRSATAPRKRSAMSRVDAPREEWILVAEIPPLVSQEQFDRVQARLASNRRFAQRNNKAHPYLLRGLVSCGVCGLACLARATIHGHRYYSCTGKLPALFSHREQKCPSRLSPAGRLDELVWSDLCDLLSHPEQASHALARAHGGQWLPQELQARQQGLRRGQASLGQQLERLTEAYLGGVVLLDEYRRRRSDLEERQRQLERQARQLDAQADRQKELAGLSGAIEDFCQRVRQGLAQATFEQRRSLVELLIDRVIVTDGEVEIRYVMPTDRAGEQVRFCHLRLDYRAGPPPRETPGPTGSRLRRLPDGATNAGRLRGDGDGEEGAGSGHRRTRHTGPGQLRRRAVPGRRLTCRLPRPFATHSNLCNRTGSDQVRPDQPARASRPPPSTGRATPVMKPASSLARNSAAFATSQAVPIRRRSGTRASRSAATSARGRPVARARVSTAMGVSISPGRMVLQRMPCPAFWNATCSVKATIAALVAL
jgi:site-specific DNA recombinase